MLFYLITTILLLIITGIFVYLKLGKHYDFNKDIVDKIIKKLAIIYIIIMFINLFLPDGFAVEKTKAQLDGLTLQA